MAGTGFVADSAAVGIGYRRDWGVLVGFHKWELGEEVDGEGCYGGCSLGG